MKQNKRFLNILEELIETKMKASIRVNLHHTQLDTVREDFLEHLRKYGINSECKSCSTIEEKTKIKEQDLPSLEELKFYGTLSYLSDGGFFSIISIDECMYDAFINQNDSTVDVNGAMDGSGYNHWSLHAVEKVEDDGAYFKGVIKFYCYGGKNLFASFRHDGGVDTMFIELNHFVYQYA